MEIQVHKQKDGVQRDAWTLENNEFTGKQQMNFS
jgi:hypothetical protein